MLEIHLCVQAFEGCVVREWNLSYACLKGYAAREALRNLRTTNVEFWEELTRLESNENRLPKSDEILYEDIEPDASLEDNDADDSDLSIKTLINVMVKNDLPAGVGTRKSGALTSIVEAENSDVVDIPLEPIECVEKKNRGEKSIDESRVQGWIEGPSSGRGKRKKVANKLYEQFWRHNDDDDADDDSLLP
jgi:hypothetical protein